MEKVQKLYEQSLSQLKNSSIMKKFLLIIIFAIYIFALSSVEGLTASDSTPTPTDSESSKSDSLNQQINALKNRIASRVAQLKLVEKRGIIGRVTNVSDTQITVSDFESNKRFIDVDELTRFSSPSVKGAFGISDVTQGTNIGVLGLYNKESRRILARFVNVLNIPKIIHGTVTLVDSKNYTLKVSTEDNKEIAFDVETTTKTLSYSKDAGLNRSGFSKIKENERIIVIAKDDSKNKNNITASKIILLPNIPKNPKTAR